MPYRHVRTISGRGGGPDQFVDALRGIAIGADDRLFAVGDSALRVFGFDGRLEHRWPTSGPGHSVAAATGGQVYVGMAGGLDVYDAAGTLLATWRDAETLRLVTAIGFAGASVLAADARARCIRRLDEHGQVLDTIGDDNRRKGFLIPNGVVDFAVDGDDVIHAANPGRHRVEHYALDGTLLGHFGRFDGQDPAGFPGCCNPTNVAVDDRQRIYVSEKAGPRTKVYDADGTLLSVVAGHKFDPACKNMDLAVDSRHRVHVVDTVTLQILTFSPHPEPAAAGAAAPPSEGGEAP